MKRKVWSRLQYQLVKSETGVGHARVGQGTSQQVQDLGLGAGLVREFWGLPARWQLPLVNVRAGPGGGPSCVRLQYPLEGVCDGSGGMPD